MLKLILIALALGICPAEARSVPITTSRVVFIFPAAHLSVSSTYSAFASSYQDSFSTLKLHIKSLDGAGTTQASKVMASGTLSFSHTKESLSTPALEVLRTCILTAGTSTSSFSIELDLSSPITLDFGSNEFFLNIDPTTAPIDIISCSRQ